MSETEKMVKLSQKEQEAWKQYDETKQQKYLNVVMECIQKRAEILGTFKASRTPLLTKIEKA